MAEQRLPWLLILAVSIIQIQAVVSDEPLCHYLDIERRLLEKMTSLSSQNAELLARLTSMENQNRKETECPSPISSPLNNVLRVTDLEYDGWTMVFRATAGNGHSVFDAWTQGKSTCDNKPETMQRSLSCHYRSNTVTSWNQLKVDRVKFALYNSDREVGHVIFNGRDTGLSTWFDKSRIVSSSWSDLTPAHTFNIFTIAGYKTEKFARRFHINRKYGGCDVDTGHIAVADTNTVPEKACKWDKHVVYPQFLYSKINSADIWNDEHYDRADYMAIFIKTY